MLIRFNVKNFLSFDSKDNGNTEEFSMLPGNVNSKNNHIYKNANIRLLKFASIYGANASGKSNLVKAIGFFKDSILKGWNPYYIDKYCKTSSENKNKPSYFEMELMIEEKYYSYGFEAILSKQQFISEWLYELLPDNTENLIFERNIEKHTHNLGVSDTGESYQKLKGYAEDIDGDYSILLLKVMNQNKKNLYKDEKYSDLEIFKQIYIWLANNLNIIHPDKPVSNFSYMFKEENIDKIREIISFFSTGIISFKFEDTTIDEMLQEIPLEIKEDILNEIVNFHKMITQEIKKELRTTTNISTAGLLFRNRKEFYILSFKDEVIQYQIIKFLHKGSNELFNLPEESDGTIRLLELLEILLSPDGKTYVIDELDRCLHPSLTYKFVDLFFKLTKNKNVQLISTTHESRLLDFNLLRRDEVWFVKKNDIGTSHIYSLEEYNERFDRKIDKAYLEGRYGGIPIFSTIFPVRE